MTCDCCGGKGFVARAPIEAGRAIWNADEVPEVIQCPLCYLNDLIGA